MRTTDGAWNPLVPYLASVMRCPACQAQEFLPASDHVVCGACGAAWQDPEAVLDLAPGHRPRRRAPWTPPVEGGRDWEDGDLSRARTVHGPVDEGALMAWANTWFKPVGQGPILELQGGFGWMSRQLARGFGVARIVLADEDLKVLRATQASPRDPGMALIRADPRRLPFADASVAGVVVVNDPPLLTEDVAAIGEVSRVLRADARVVALLQVREDGWGAVVAGARAALGGSPPPAEGTVQEVWRQAGLDVLAWTRIGSLVLVAGRRSPMARS